MNASGPGSGPRPEGPRAAGRELPDRGVVRVGPRPLHRTLPLWLVSWNVVALVFSGAAADAWRAVGVALPVVTGYAVGWASLMVLLLAGTYLVFSRQVPLRVDLDERTMLRRTGGTLLSRGTRELRPLADLRSVAEHPRGSAYLEIRSDDEDLPTVWEIAHVGWDRESWDGMRALQRAAGLPVSPPLEAARLMAHRAEEVVHQREAAQRVALPWRAEYDADPAAFRRDYDTRRQQLAARAKERRRSRR